MKCPLLILLFNVVLEILTSAIRQKKKSKASGLERIKTVVTYKWHYPVYGKKNPKESTNLIGKFSLVAGYIIIITKSTVFLQ